MCSIDVSSKHSKSLRTSFARQKVFHVAFPVVYYSQPNSYTSVRLLWECRALTMFFFPFNSKYVCVYEHIVYLEWLSFSIGLISQVM